LKYVIRKEENILSNLDQANTVISQLSEDDINLLGPRWFYDEAQLRIIYVEDDIPVGFIETRIIGKRCYLNIAVLSDHRNKGISDALISGMKELIIQDYPDVNKIFYITKSDNQASINLATRTGFIDSGSKDGYTRYSFVLKEDYSIEKVDDDFMVYSEVKKSVTQTDFSLQMNIFKVDEMKGIVYGKALIPNYVDSQSDICTPEEVEKIAHGFMIGLQMPVVQKSQLGDMHENFGENPWEIGLVLESYISPDDGSWVLVTKPNEVILEKIKKQEITGYSIGGVGFRTPLEIDDENLVEKVEKNKALSSEITQEISDIYKQLTNNK